MLEKDLDLIPFLQAPRILELVDRDRALRLEPDVEDDGGIGDAEHLRFDDLTLLDVREGPLVQLRHLRDFVRGVLFVEIGADPQGRVAAPCGGGFLPWGPGGAGGVPPFPFSRWVW